MAAVSDNPTPPERRHFSIRLPRPLSLGLLTVLLIVGACGLRIGARAYRQRAIIREFDRLNVRYQTRPSGPDWLRDGLLRFGFNPRWLLQEVDSVRIGYDV